MRTKLHWTAVPPCSAVQEAAGCQQRGDSNMIQSWLSFLKSGYRWRKYNIGTHWKLSAFTTAVHSSEIDNRTV